MNTSSPARHGPAILPGTRDRGVPRLRSVAAAVALTACLAGIVAVPATAAASTRLAQLPGTAACTSSSADPTCASGVGLDGASSVTVSPDGRSAYAASHHSVAVFDRAANGTLTQKPGLAGCISDSGAGPCVNGTALKGASSVTVSPDGRSAYVASRYSDAVAVFDRASNGTLTQKRGKLGCVSDFEVNSCVTGRTLSGAKSVTVSPDGRSVYVAAQIASAVAIFDRSADGTLTQKPDAAGCISGSWGGGYCTPGTALGGATSVTVSPDGANAYVASSKAVAILNRAKDGTLTQWLGKGACVGSGSSCVSARALDGAASVTISPDARNAYVASVGSDAIAVFDRGTNGWLTQRPGTAGCISETGAGPCADGRALEDPFSVTIAPDGSSAFVASAASNAVVALDRAADGSLSQEDSRVSCISLPTRRLPCVIGTALGAANAVAVSPDGANVYVASSRSDAVAAFSRSIDAPCPPEVCQIEDPREDDPSS